MVTVLPYEITVTTGDVLNAGTDANVTLQLYGEDGKSESIKLRNRTDNFERNSVDKFKVCESSFWLGFNSRPREFCYLRLKAFSEET